VRVAVLTAPSRDAVVSFPDGGEVRDGRSGQQSPGFPVRVGPGGQVRIRFDGARYTATAAGGGTAAADPSAARAADASASPPATAPVVPAASPGQAPAATAAEGSTTTTVPGTTTTTQPVIGFPTSTTLPAPTTTATTTAPPPPPPGGGTPAPAAGTAASGRTLWAVPRDGGTVGVPARSQRYRGVVEATAGGGPLRLLNEVDVEQYLRGMGEVRNPGWPPASLRAQAIAARTYALRAMSLAGELCDTQRCQVYLGADAEYAAMNKAVSDTARQVIVFGKSLASAVYSANGGGFSASREEGFGTTGDGFPYLRPAPYDTKDTSPWSVQIALTDLAPRFGYPGQLTAARVSRAGPSGRALEVTLDGSAGARVVSGLNFDAGLGLKSTLFTLRGDIAAVAPPPPAPGEGLQALPEELAPTAAPAAVPDAAGLGAAGAPRRAGSTGGGPGGPLTAAALLLNASAGAAVYERLVRRPFW
jgi:stage II sporulation protein D